MNECESAFPVPPIAAPRARGVLRYLKSEKSAQVLVLYAATLTQTILGFLTSILLTRALRPEQYGNYMYLFNLVSFVLVLVSTGHFVSISMMLAQKKNRGRERQLLGASLILTMGVCAILSVILFFFSFLQDRMFQVKLGHSIRVLAPVLLLFPLQTYLENVLTGLSRIKSLAFFRVAPKALYLISIPLLSKLMQLSYMSAFVLLLVTSYVIYIVQVIALKPSLADARGNLKVIEAENKRYGFHVYLGTIANVSTAYVCTLSIAYFATTTELGFFGLALTISNPLALLPNVIATSFFKNFADLVKIPNKLLCMTLSLCAVSYLAFAIIVDPAVAILYSKAYVASARMAYILGLASILQGIGDVFNRFLCAHGRGMDVRNGAFWAGGANVVAFLILVPLFAGLGAAITRLAVSVAYVTAMLIYYRCEIARNSSFGPT